MMRGRHPWAHVALIAAALLCWAPIWFMIVVASHDSSAATTFPPPAVPGGELGVNLGRVLSTLTFAHALVNSLVVSGTVAMTASVLCALAGFAFAKLRFRGRGALFAMVLLGLTLPVQLAVIPSYLLVSALGWVDSLTGVVVPALASAFGVFWMRQHIAAGLSDDVLDAAALDGCGPWRAFRHVALPFVRPGVAVLAGILFVSTWSDFFWPFLILRSPGTHTIQIALSALRSEYGVDYSLVFAGALLATVPVILLVVATGRWMSRGGVSLRSGPPDHR